MNKRSIIISLAFVSLIADTIVFGQRTQAAVDVPQALPQLRYAVVDLGEDAAANGITDSGRIIGSKNFGGPDRHAAFWPNSQNAAIDLGTLPGFDGSRGLGINARGQIVGAAFPFSSAQPLYWASSQSTPMELPGLPNGFQGLAPAINPVGQIVGTFFSADFSVQRPVFWPKNNAAPIYLLMSKNFPVGVAISINAAGNIFGDGCTADFVECHCAFWANNTSLPAALASPAGEFIYTDVGFSSGSQVAPALNNVGSMVGYAYNADFSETRAVYLG